MEYKIGNTIYDPDGNEWMITHKWDYKDQLCLSLVGTSDGILGQIGGTKVDYEEEGGLTVNVR